MWAAGQVECRNAPPLFHSLDYPSPQLVQCGFGRVGFYGRGERFSTCGTESMVLGDLVRKSRPAGDACASVLIVFHVTV